MTKQYRLAYTMREPCEDNGEMFLAEVPSLPGCCAWADTPEEALWILGGCRRGVHRLPHQAWRPSAS